jgi:SAM-dependent methyltransferase
MKPENFSNFYTESKLGFDLYLVEKGYYQLQPYFFGSTCLELGPATGYMTKLLVQHFESVEAIEGSETLINQIPDYDNLIKHNCLFEEFSSSKKFDTIILNHVLEHIEKPIELLKLLKTLLSDKGTIIVGVPNAQSFHRLAAVKMGLLDSIYTLNERDIELGHCRVYDFNLLKEHVQRAELEVINDGGIFLKFLSNSQIETMLSNEIIDAYFELANDFQNNSAEIFVVLKKPNSI